MQKDFHYYITHALARKASLPEARCRLIAWADQYTDDLTDADLYGIQTQCNKVGNWFESQIQLSVLVPFHFVPGDDPEWPWKTTEDSARARKMVEASIETGNLHRLGIALHAYQDTFSHQGFSGWQEDRNACYPWYDLSSALPNVGHTEMMTTPDMIDQVWTDPRSKEIVDNRKRALRAAKATFGVLARVSGIDAPGKAWKDIAKELRPILKIKGYDERKEAIVAMAGGNVPRYSKIKKQMASRHRAEFIRAATGHLGDVVRLLEDLPR